MDIGDFGDESGFDGMASGVAEFGGKSEGGGFVRGIELGVGEGVAQGYVTAGRKKNFAPDAGVFVGRSGIPVDPGEAEIIFFGGEDFEGEGVLPFPVQ